jgi:hypothetical protein
MDIMTAQDMLRDQSRRAPSRKDECSERKDIVAAQPANGGLQIVIPPIVPHNGNWKPLASAPFIFSR